MSESPKPHIVKSAEFGRRLTKDERDTAQDGRTREQIDGLEDSVFHVPASSTTVSMYVLIEQLTGAALGGAVACIERETVIVARLTCLLFAQAYARGWTWNFTQFEAGFFYLYPLPHFIPCDLAATDTDGNLGIDELTQTTRGIWHLNRRHFGTQADPVSTIALLCDMRRSARAKVVTTSAKDQKNPRHAGLVAALLHDPQM